MSPQSEKVKDYRYNLVDQSLGLPHPCLHLEGWSEKLELQKEEWNLLYGMINKSIPEASCSQPITETGVAHLISDLEDPQKMVFLLVQTQVSLKMEHRKLSYTK